MNSYAVSHHSKLQAPEHLPGDEPRYTHQVSVWGPEPSRIPRRISDAVANDEVVDQGFSIEDIG